MQTEAREFERLVEALGFLPHEYLDSSALREWVRQNKDYKYVPSELLKAWGLADK
jgi:hypothetical protein